MLVGAPLGPELSLASAPNFLSLATENTATLGCYFAATSRAGLSERTRQGVCGQERGVDAGSLVPLEHP